MNIKEYISSGILEAYVLGDVNAAERAEVEANIQLYPEIRAELALIEETQEKLLRRLASTPPGSVKANVFANVDQRNSNVRALSTVATWRLGAAASLSIAIIAGVLAFHYWSKWKTAESNYGQLLAQNERIAQDYNNVNKRLDQVEQDIQVFQNPDFKKIILTGTTNAPEALASVYWNEKTSELFLSVQNMKVLSAQNQYQLWAIIDGKPVDAGVFNSAVTGLVRMKNVSKGAATFAVTIEHLGGNSAPTLETMQVAGHVIRG